MLQQLRSTRLSDDVLERAAPRACTAARAPGSRLNCVPNTFLLSSKYPSKYIGWLCHCAGAVAMAPVVYYAANTSTSLCKADTRWEHSEGLGLV